MTERAPMAAVAVCFAAGIALEWAVWWPAWLLMASAGTAAGLSLRERRRPVHANLLALLAVLVAGGFAAGMDSRARADDIQRRVRAEPTVLTLVGTLAGEPELSRSGRGWSAWFLVEADARGSPLSGRVQLRLPSRAGTFLYGERLRVTGLLRRGRRRSGSAVRFEEARWLWVHGASAVLTVADPQGVTRLGLRGDPARRYRRWVARQGARLECWLDLHLDPSSSGYLKGLLLGRGGEFSPEVWERFRRTGTVHVLVVSGLHVGLIGLMVLTVLAMLRVPRRPRYLLLALALCSYCILTGVKPPIVRSTLTGILFCGAAILGLVASPSNLLGAAAAGMLAFCPRALADASFQLSFAAVIGLLAGSHAQNRLGSARAELRWMLQPFSASCGAWLATAPILAWHFRNVAWAAPLANLVVVPWASLLIALGFVLCLLGPVLPSAAPPLAAAFRFLAAGLDRCVGGLAGAPWQFWEW